MHRLVLGYCSRYWRGCSIPGVSPKPVTALHPQIVNETLPTLLGLKREGVIKAIGITGYPLDVFTYVLDKYVASSKSWV